MRILNLIGKDIHQLVRDWQTIFFMLVMPVAFTLMFGFVFSGAGGSDEDQRLPVGYLDLDEGALSQELDDLLTGSDVLRLESAGSTRDELEEAVADEEFAGALIIPEDYSQGALSGEPRSLIVIVNSASTSGITVQQEIQSAAMRMANAVQGAQVSTDLYAEHAGFEDAGTREQYFKAGMQRSLAAWSNPPVTLENSFTGALVDLDDEGAQVYGDNPFNHSSTSMMAQFAVAGLMSASSLLVLERKNGTMQRLMTTRISRTEYLFGHYLTMVLMVFMQLFLLTVFGHLLLDVQYYSDPASTLALIAVCALFSASLGLLIGGVARKEEHVIIISLVVMLLLSAIGGAWVPLEFTPEGFQQVAHFTPLAWMIDGFKDIVIRGLGMQAILPAIYVLFAFTLALFALAVWRFRSL